MRKIFVIIMLTFYTLNIYAAPADRNTPINLSSNHMNVQIMETHTITHLWENVVVANSDYTITTEKADIYTDKNDELQKIICTGNVNFKSISMNMLAVADKAVLDHLTQILTLTGNVQVHQADRVMKTEKIVVYYETGQLVAGDGTDGGGVNMIINSLEGLNKK